MALIQRCVAALAAAGASGILYIQAEVKRSPGSTIGALLCLVAAVALGAYAAFGFVDPPFSACIGVLFLLGFATALLMRSRRSQQALETWARMRPLAIVLAIPVGFYLMERPWNDTFFSMDPYYIVVNLCVLAALFALVYLAGQRSRGAIAAFLAVCFIAGIANHFVIAFKGQPVVPADLFALSTAASVGAGYSFVLDARLIETLIVFVGACTVLAFVPKVQATARRVCINTTLAVAIAASFGWWMTSFDLEEAYGCTVDVWSVKESYADQGSTLCFLKRFQDLSPAQPEGYSPSFVEELLAGQPEETEASVEETQQPTVIAIMNETFSDLSHYPGLADTDARPAAYYDIAASALESGKAYVSALGGGTCNSEFEFLTGSSMGYLGGGVYPYVLYDLEDTESLVSYFSTQGYSTHALHPAESTNWRRNVVYEQLGFDEFSDQSAFEGADTLRGLTADRATYDYVLNLLAEDENPQFIFDVTIQNHGGYDVGGISEDLTVSVPLSDGSVSSELDEYASCIQQADRDLAYLVNELNALDRPVVLCFFGDHQPGFSDWLFEATHDGSTADDLGLDSVQKRYSVPYMIWANDAARAQGVGANMPDTGTDERTSLNYLGAKLVAATGQPLSSYQRFLLAVREVLPAINLNGFLTADGIWHWFGEETEADEAMQAYAAVQYDNLFNKDSTWQ